VFSLIVTSDFSKTFAKKKNKKNRYTRLKIIDTLSGNKILIKSLSPNILCPERRTPWQRLRAGKYSLNIQYFILNAKSARLTAAFDPSRSAAGGVIQGSQNIDAGSVVKRTSFCQAQQFVLEGYDPS